MIKIKSKVFRKKVMEIFLLYIQKKDKKLASKLVSGAFKSRPNYLTLDDIEKILLHLEIVLDVARSFKLSEVFINYRQQIVENYEEALLNNLNKEKVMLENIIANIEAPMDAEKLRIIDKETANTLLGE